MKNEKCGEEYLQLSKKNIVDYSKLIALFEHFLEYGDVFLCLMILLMIFPSK
ncbi:hypothetical protein K502DRAFT_326627 [Neoconidiobolus thromboides FSU 785]|nr:hypothetical protein K502DRAFT_326627 [Neoconidiobolus thromboides FSU 785]